MDSWNNNAKIIAENSQHDKSDSSFTQELYPKKSSSKISDQEQRYYIAQAQAGDLLAKEYLIEKNMGLVYSLVQRFLGRGFEKDDLCQVGIIGLLKAIGNFDLSFNNCFSTYAVPMIIGEIKRSIRDDQPLHISRTYKELAFKIYKAKEVFMQEQGKEPSLGELADVLHISKNAVVIALEANQKPASLQTPLEENNGKASGPNSQLQDIIANEEGEDKWLEQLQLKQIFEKLPSRLQYVIDCRYYKEMTQEDVAKVLGVSQVQISRLEKQALAILKEYWQG